MIINRDTRKNFNSTNEERSIVFNTYDYNSVKFIQVHIVSKEEITYHFEKDSTDGFDSPVLIASDTKPSGQYRYWGPILDVDDSDGRTYFRIRYSVPANSGIKLEVFGYRFESEIPDSASLSFVLLSSLDLPVLDTGSDKVWLLSQMSNHAVLYTVPASFSKITLKIKLHSSSPASSITLIDSSNNHHVVDTNLLKIEDTDGSVLGNGIVLENNDSNDAYIEKFIIIYEV